MDINSLLSPQDSPAAETPPPPALPSPSLQSLQSPSKRAIRQMPSRTPSGLSQQHITSSPQHFRPDALPTPTPPLSAHAQAAFHHHVSPALPALPSPGLAGYTNGRPMHSATSTPPVDTRPLGSPHVIDTSHPLHRQGSTPGMDALADLASMQHVQQTARQHGAGQRPSISLQNIPRSISGSSAADIAMAESPKPPLPRIFQTKALDGDNIKALAQLDDALRENPFNYYSHVNYISILHQGLQNVLNGANGSPAGARTYELLPQLREAYEAMDSKYVLGEQLWEFRINDEKALSRTVEERMAVLELCQKATQEEPYSPKLWVIYGEYISSLIACVWDSKLLENWTEEDRTVGREIFTMDLLMSTWQSGAEHVKSNISESNLVWDRYLQLLQDDLDRQFSPDKARRVSSIFNDRLKQPHATWDQTLSQFSTFNSKYNATNYESIMESAVQQNAHIKKTYSLREDFEFSLLQAAQKQDQDAEYFAVTRYLKWEKKTIGVSSFPLVNSLFERATLRFPVDPSLWEDYVEFLIWQNNRTVSLVDVLQRATRHCPWSGSLWCHRILTLEAENKDFKEIERVKHVATGTGMLEHTDLEELIRVQIAWCSYLRRKAFDNPNATEDDADIAEVGIRSALELAHGTGIKKYGNDWAGDPLYRLERIHIKFWTQRGNLEEARQIFDSLTKHQQDSYDFWYRYYIWEMVVWSNHATRDKANAGKHLLTPTGATAVLERGMKRLSTIDQPEPLIEMYVNHCEQHESALKVRSANIERRRAERTVSIRREKERTAAGAEAAAEAAAAHRSDHHADVSGKRKRDGATEADGLVAKKSKQVDSDASPLIAPSVEVPARTASEAPSTRSSTQKRDREHTSIIVRGLPEGTKQTRIRQFFTDAGTVRNIKLKPDRGKLTATVEFESPEEAEYALIKESKGFEGHPITIKRGESTTLYVTNYPPETGDRDIRDLFGRFGEILDLRFPSLKFNAHRRFCYIQFASPDEAVAAIELDGKELEGHILNVKLSDPTARKKRDGATEDGREVYVWHLNYKLKRSEILEAFSKFGVVERINLPTAPNGNNKGMCYVTYETKEDADLAVVEMNGKEFGGLDLHVDIAKAKGEAKPKIRSQILNTTSPEVDEPVPAQSIKSHNAAPVPMAERTIALLGIPDTVGDERIKNLVQSYGFKKITLLPQHQGAIIEFAEVSSVGKASLALDGYEISEGRKIRVGTVAELKKMKSEFKPSNNFIQPTRVNRPVAKGTALRGKGKPGLGHRTVASTAAPIGEAKSNQDFRAMLLGKKAEDMVKQSDDQLDSEMVDRAS